MSAYDLFPKIADDFAQRTATGGVISLVSLACAALLFAQQFMEFATTRVAYDLRVDDRVVGGHGAASTTMRIHVDVSVHAMSCAQLSVDVMDVTGTATLDVASSAVIRQRLDSRGRVISMTQETTVLNEQHAVEVGQSEDGDGTLKCGDCYGAAPDRCCNDCNAVRQAYRIRGWAMPDMRTIEQCRDEFDEVVMHNLHNEGCRFRGHMDVNKVAGNFHIAPGKSYAYGGQHVHDLSPFTGLGAFNFSHTIHSVWFGEEALPGVIDPLDGVRRVMTSKAGTYQYRLQIVPARYTFIGLNARVVDSNEYSVTDHFRPFDPAEDASLPGIFFFYDLSPLRVEYEERRIGFFAFLTNVAAIVGGVYAVSGIVDGAVHAGARAMKEKVDLGKQG